MAKPIVLVVDNDENILMLYRHKLAQWDLTVELETVRDGFEALLTIGRRRPQLLIVDLNMPGMDGFRLVRALRASTYCKDLPIIAISDMDRDSIGALGLPGDVAVFSKPIPFPELQQAMQKMLKPAEV